MLVLLSALLVGVIAGLLAGGRLANLAQVCLTHPELVLAGLLLQVAAFSPVGARLGTTVDVVLHLLSYALLAMFVVVNRRRFGMIVAGLGLGLNAVVIVANAGYMPAARGALTEAGVTYAGSAHNNSELIHAGTRLSGLADVMAVPAWFPLANVFSVGDVLIVLGVALLIAGSMRTAHVVTAAADAV